jgi:hypothetical protein
LIAEFKKPKSESQCITELKEIKQKVVEPVWEFDQRFKTLAGRLNFQIPDEKNKEWFIACPLTTHQSSCNATEDRFAG